MLCGIKIGKIICNRRDGEAVLIFPQTNPEIGFSHEIVKKEKNKQIFIRAGTGVI